MEILQEIIKKIEIDETGTAFTISERVIKDDTGVITTVKHRGEATNAHIADLRKKKAYKDKMESVDG